MANQTNSNFQDLLTNQQVVEEIRRHLWIESEKAGYDIGFENAARDWLEKFSRAWMEYHMPRNSEKPAAVKRSVKSVKANGAASVPAKRPVRRSAKKI